MHRANVDGWVALLRGGCAAWLRALRGEFCTAPGNILVHTLVRPTQARARVSGVLPVRADSADVAHALAHLEQLAS